MPTTTELTFTDLPTAIALYDADVFPLDQNGLDQYTKKVRFNTLYTAISTVILASTTANITNLQAAKANKSGDTFTGNIVLSTTPTSPLHAIGKGYVDNLHTLNLQLTGGYISGFITLSADPNSPMQAATKNYVDVQIANTTSAFLSTSSIVSVSALSASNATKAFVSFNPRNDINGAAGFTLSARQMYSSYNVLSVIRTAVGQYDIVFDIPFTNTNYSVVATSTGPSVASLTTTPSATRVSISIYSSTFSLSDSARCSVTCM